MTCDINLNQSGIEADIKKAVAKAQKKLDAVVLADSNYFIPKDTHTLEASGVENTVIGAGLVIWRTPYARRQYYGEHFDHSKQHNPNACAKWFEAAKARFLEKWRAIIIDSIKHN